MASQGLEKTKELTSGMFGAFKKSIKQLTIGTLISLLTTILIRFIEIAFGFAWENNLTYLLLSYGYLVATTAQSVYMAFKNYLKEGIFYIIGWAISSLLLYRYGIINSETLFNALLIPSIIVVIKIIYSFVKSKKKQPVKRY